MTTETDRSCCNPNHAPRRQEKLTHDKGTIVKTYACEQCLAENEDWWTDSRNYIQDILMSFGLGRIDNRQAILQLEELMATELTPASANTI